jgi:hypothetical protein
MRTFSKVVKSAPFAPFLLHFLYISFWGFFKVLFTILSFLLFRKEKIIKEQEDLKKHN